MDDHELTPLEIERERLKLRIEFWKAIVSLFLFCCCGMFVLLMPAASYLARVIAAWNDRQAAPTSALNDWACFFGVLAILAWGVNTMIPILRIFKDRKLTTPEETNDAPEPDLATRQ